MDIKKQERFKIAEKSQGFQKIAAILNKKIAPKDRTSGIIPIFKELSRDLPPNFDPEITPLKERRVISAITTMAPYSGRPGAAIIESALEEIALDEIILVSLLTPPSKYIFRFYVKISIII